MLKKKIIIIRDKIKIKKKIIEDVQLEWYSYVNMGETHEENLWKSNSYVLLFSVLINIFLFTMCYYYICC